MSTFASEITLQIGGQIMQYETATKWGMRLCKGSANGRRCYIAQNDHCEVNKNTNSVQDNGLSCTYENKLQHLALLISPVGLADNTEANQCSYFRQN